MIDGRFKLKKGNTALRYSSRLKMEFYNDYKFR